MKEFLQVDESFYDNDDVLNYYWNQKLFRLFEDILTQDKRFESLVGDFPYCWYVARKIIAKSYLSEFPERQLIHQTDRLNRFNALDGYLRSIAKFGISLILISIKIKNYDKSISKEELLAKIIQILHEQYIVLLLSDTYIDLLLDYFTDNNIDWEDTIDYTQQDLGIEEYAAPKKIVKQQDDDEKSVIIQLQNEIKEKNRIIQKMKENNQKENEEVVELKRKDGKGGYKSKEITAKECAEIFNEYDYTNGLNKTQVKEILSKITGLSGPSFTRYL